MLPAEFFLPLAHPDSPCRPAFRDELEQVRRPLSKKYNSGVSRTPLRDGWPDNQIQPAQAFQASTKHYHAPLSFQYHAILRQGTDHGKNFFSLKVSCIPQYRSNNKIPWLSGMLYSYHGEKEG